MHVAFIGPGTLTIPPNGWGAIERVIWNLQQHGLAAGFESTIVNHRTEGEIRAECERFVPDIIHLHAHWRLKECLPYLKDRPTPLVTTCHDFKLGELLPSTVAPIIEQSTAVIALSPAIASRL